MLETAELLKKVRKLEIVAGQLVEDVIGGAYHSVFKGRGIEFDEVREYTFEDDVRDIDWRVTARKEKPYTKLYTEERDREIFVWLDLSAFMLFGSSMELKSVTASKIAALIGWIALNNKDRFGCVIFDGKKSWVFKPKNDRAYLGAIFSKISEISQNILSQEQNNEEERIKSLKLLQSNVKNQANVFVISSFVYFNDEYDKIWASLAKKTGLFMINVFDKLEEKAPLSGQYMVEYNGEKLLMDTSSKIYKKNYAEYFSSKLKQKEIFCRKMSCNFINFSSDMSFTGDLKIL
jgi:uncharacterized protein (DUF58 family)